MSYFRCKYSGNRFATTSKHYCDPWNPHIRGMVTLNTTEGLKNTSEPHIQGVHDICRESTNPPFKWNAQETQGGESFSTPDSSTKHLKLQTMLVGMQRISLERAAIPSFGSFWEQQTRISNSYCNRGCKPLAYTALNRRVTQQ